MNKIEEFSKFYIRFKTVTYNEKEKLVQHMSFENFDFEEAYATAFDDSELKVKLEATQWLFVVFQKNKEDKAVLKGIKFWTVPEEIL
ncbi:hypothetical protein BN1048_01926 [Jeotgalicoccus saudimassiliensis]|uniref:Uncharacterized protein n=1 Tax=Jeotgalicoccus saudimassiliensis TaxID=1461582 RepID=A0A078MBY6_9STAP|nr:hypothetical protein [Jeotgalicoccus saudimassiliensis]CEA02957.1 hypothetical protein BN1048_01926 [Jeotgalicoccus saudimassiliensis]